jgi:hypothetical protein
VLHVEPGEHDPVTLLARTPVKALFIAAERDRIVPLAELRRLCDVAGDGSRLIVVPHATHEALPYYFEELVPPVLTWFRNESLPIRPEPAP